MENIISLRNIVVEFDGEKILKNIDLDIRDKEFVTLLGPSGCGKTTTLRIIGGFLTPTSGDVLLDGKRINDLPPHKRDVNTVFQKYALFPHLNVYENIAFGLRIKKVSEKEIVRRVGEMLELVNLTGFEKRSIQRLSGGQQQRVAIARALVNHPKILLLDEPLGALDLKLRKDMQTELRKIQQALELTFVYVTHDQEEALTMSDTVVVMNNGHIQQIGSPIDIYNEPVNAFVADFIGETVDVVIRPEDVKVIPAEQAQLTGIVESVVFKGVHYEMTVDCVDHKWLIHSTKAEPVGSVIGMTVDPFDIHIMKKSKQPGSYPALMGVNDNEEA